MKRLFFAIALIVFLPVNAGDIKGDFGFNFGEYLDRSKEKFSSFQEYLPGFFRSSVYKYGTESKEAISYEYHLIVTHRDSIAAIIKYETLAEDISDEAAVEEIDLCEAGALGSFVFYQEEYNLRGKKKTDGVGFTKYVKFSLSDGRNSISIRCDYMQGNIIRTTRIDDSILLKMTNEYPNR